MNSEKQVIVLGIDALDWMLIEKGIAEGKLSSFKYLKEQGSWGKLESIEPYLSPMIWTTIATGQPPDKHGILDFLTTDKATGKTVPVTSNLRQVKAIWNILSERKALTHVVGWYATWPVEPINGIMVSDRLALHGCLPKSVETKLESNEALTFPASYLSILRANNFIVEPDTVKARMLPQLFEHGIPDTTADDMPTRINEAAKSMATDETYFNITMSLAKNEPFNLLMAYTSGLDAVCHLFMPYAPERREGVSEELYKQLNSVIDRYYAYLDNRLGMFILMLKPEQYLMLVSDHGFKSNQARPLTDSRIGAGGAPEWHRRYGALALLGPDVKKGYEIKGASVYDIMPTLLAMFGLPPSEEMPGRILSQAFNKDFLKDKSLKRIDSYDHLEAKTSPEPITSEYDDTIRERLETLGYVGSTSPQTHNNRGLTLLEQGKFEQARKEFEQATALSNDFYPAWNNLGETLRELRELETAREAYEKALDLAPEDKRAGIVHNIGITFLQQEKPEEALQKFEQALTLSPNNPAILNDMGSCYIQLGQFEKALKIFAQALENPGDVALELQLNRILALRKLARGEEALALAMEIAEQHPHDAGAFMALGTCLGEQGAFREALSAFQKATELAPDNYDAFINLGITLGRLEMYKDAGKVFQKALKIRPSAQQAKQLLAMAEEKSGVVIGQRGTVYLHLLFARRENAEAFLEEIKDNKSFVVLQDEYEKQGKLLSRSVLKDPKPDEVISPIKQVIGLLDIGETSDIIESEHGFHVLKRLY